MIGAEKLPLHVDFFDNSTSIVSFMVLSGTGLAQYKDNFKNQRQIQTFWRGELEIIIAREKF